MKLQIMAVRDMAAEAYLNPWFVPAVGLGIRAFQDEVNRSAADNPMFQHSGDFALFHFGEFDNGTGSFNLFDNAERVADGKAMKNGGV